MKTTRTSRLARLTGLSLLALLVLALGVQVAQAAVVSGTGAGGGPDGLSATALAGTQGRGGVTYAPPGSGGVTYAPAAPLPRTAGVQPTTMGTSSSTGWIIAGSVAAAVVVGLGAWALVARRRRTQPGSEAYCLRHPSDALCGAV